jgi:hypothetical protein
VPLPFEGRLSGPAAALIRQGYTTTHYEHDECDEVLSLEGLGSSSVTEYSAFTTGNSAPTITIPGGADTDLTFPGALALATPFAITQPATALATTSATLQGSVNPQGIATNDHFQYGTSTAYGQTTPTVSAGDGSNTVTASAAVSGLTPGTVYHYRVVASSDTGTENGADGTFTTPAG